MWVVLYEKDFLLSELTGALLCPKLEGGPCGNRDLKVCKRMCRATRASTSAQFVSVTMQKLPSELASLWLTGRGLSHVTWIYEVGHDTQIWQARCPKYSANMTENRDEQELRSDDQALVRVLSVPKFN